MLLNWIRQLLGGRLMTMIAFAVPILDGKLEDWKHMILDTMHGDNKQSTDQSRENAGVHERSYLQKMESGHACILTWEGEHPLPFWLDLMDVALPEFTRNSCRFVMAKVSLTKKIHKNVS